MGVNPAESCWMEMIEAWRSPSDEKMIISIFSEDRDRDPISSGLV